MILEIKKIEAIDALSELKSEYFTQARSALDGMWHFGFVEMAEHFAFYEDDLIVGYCCVNGEGYMLQFYLSATSRLKAADIFTMIAQQNSAVIAEIKGAFVSTAEAHYLSLCLDNSSSFKVNALMYQQGELTNLNGIRPLTMKLAQAEEVDDFVAFAVEAIGAPEQWLKSYYENLIQRQELWGYWENNHLIASGECRLSGQFQVGYADLGMIVAQSERGKGLATGVLKSMTNIAKQQGLKAICSTENGNIGAQKAIANAGFFSLDRIIQFEFDCL